MYFKTKKHDSGLTLVELMVAIAVAAILLTIVTPGYQNLILSNRISSQTNELVTALTVARTEAVRSGQQTSLCARDNNWQQGWLVTQAENCATAVANNDWIREWGESGVSVSGSANIITFDALGARTGAGNILLTLNVGNNIADREIRIGTGGMISSRVKP